MSYRSNIRIIMGPKAYALLESNCLKSENLDVKNMVLKPSDIDKECLYYTNDGEQKEDAVYIEWDDIKWKDTNEDIIAVISTLNEIDSIVEEDEDKLEEYFYKFMKIGENNESIEFTNDYDDEYVEEYYIVCGFSK